MSDSQHGAAFLALHTTLQHDDSAKVVFAPYFGLDLNPKMAKSIKTIVTIATSTIIFYVIKI